MQQAQEAAHNKILTVACILLSSVDLTTPQASGRDFASICPSDVEL